jgi:hypothetical protein
VFLLGSFLLSLIFDLNFLNNNGGVVFQVDLKEFSGFVIEIAEELDSVLVVVKVYIDSELLQDVEIDIIKTLDTLLELGRFALEFREFVKNYGFAKVFWNIDTLDFGLLQVGDRFANLGCLSFEMAL